MWIHTTDDRYILRKVAEWHTYPLICTLDSDLYRSGSTGQIACSLNKSLRLGGILALTEHVLTSLDQSGQFQGKSDLRRI